MLSPSTVFVFSDLCFVDFLQRNTILLPFLSTLHQLLTTKGEVDADVLCVRPHAGADQPPEFASGEISR